MRTLICGVLIAAVAWPAQGMEPDRRDGANGAWRAQMEAARAAYYADLEGNRDADADARRRFTELAQQHPNEAALKAYMGSLQLLDAARTWAVWRKHTLSQEGLSAMDEAVNANPGDLEALFVRALTTWHLPFFFHRKQQAEADLAILGPRAEQAARAGELPPPLAAAALDYWGQVLAERSQTDGARKAYLAAVRVDRGSPGGADALKRLR